MLKGTEFHAGSRGHIQCDLLGEALLTVWSEGLCREAWPDHFPREPKQDVRWGRWPGEGLAPAGTLLRPAVRVTTCPGISFADDPVPQGSD